MRIHIINPAADFPGYHTADFFAAWGLGGRSSVADLSSTTLAAFVPLDWEIRLTDEAITPLPDHPTTEDADIVAITGKSSQRNRMLQLADRYRAMGLRVVIGGSYASLSPEDVRCHADVLVTGEIEDIAAELFADLAAGRPRDRYEGTRPDLRRSPLPRWDLYPNESANMGAIQTSRGCPFQCDFCDVIQYLGRKQRHKEPDQVIAELDILHRHGYRSVFLADDNFTVYRSRAQNMLTALRRWNETHADAPMRFMTQVSIDLARDADLMSACKAAGLDNVFIGIETINKDSLRQSGKLQNLYQSTSDALATILSHGIAVSGGIIVGFDADGLDIFDRLAGFIDDCPVPVLSVGALVAPPGTPLHDRLAAEGRLADDSPQSAAHPFSTNIHPARMSRRDLLDGLARLCNEIYSPAAYGRRIAKFLEAYGGANRPAQTPQAIPLSPLLRTVLKRLSGFGAAEKQMILEAMAAARFRPDAQVEVMGALARYAQIRYMLGARTGGTSAG